MSFHLHFADAPPVQPSRTIGLTLASILFFSGLVVAAGALFGKEVFALTPLVQGTMFAIGTIACVASGVYLTHKTV